MKQVKLDTLTATYYVADSTTGEVIAANFLTRREAVYYLQKLGSKKDD